MKKRSKYTPTFDKAFRGWTVKEARRRYARLAPMWEFEDLLQEGACIFVKCCRRYPKIKTPEHMMALYKTAYTRHLIDLTLRAYRYRKHMVGCSADAILSTAESEVSAGGPVLPRSVSNAMLARMSTFNEGPLNCILAKFGGSVEIAAEYLRKLPKDKRAEWLAAARG